MAIKTKGRGIYKLKDGKGLFFELKRKSKQKNMSFFKYLRSIGLTRGSIYAWRDGVIKKIERKTYLALEKEFGDNIRKYIDLNF